MARSGESARIELLHAVLARAVGPGVVHGIGDDAAVLEPSDAPLCWTTDVQVEHVHFRRSWLSNRELGYRATMAAASDLAAMGARPRGVLASLVLPPTFDDEELTELAAGQLLACDELGTAVVGGNLAAGSELSITTTALGQADRPLLRSGAGVDDVLLMAGAVGLAAAGVELLEQQNRAMPWAPTRAQEAALLAFRQPVARIDDGLRAAAVATAAIDVSDGLAADVTRLARQARERGTHLQMALEPAALLDPALVEVAPEIGRAALELCLHGGDDYALVITAASGTELEGFKRIGTCRLSTADAPELVLVAADGSLEPVEPRGYDHFPAGR